MENKVKLVTVEEALRYAGGSQAALGRLLGVQRAAVNQWVVRGRKHLPELQSFRFELIRAGSDLPRAEPVELEAEGVEPALLADGAPLAVTVESRDATLLRVLAAAWCLSPEEAASHLIHRVLSREDCLVSFASEISSERLRSGY